MAPRDWLQQPDQYGLNPDAAWHPKPDNPRDAATYAAAHLQHHFACHVADTCRRSSTPIVAVAERAGLSEGHVNHILRGRQTLSLAHMIAIVTALDRIDLFPAPNNINDLYP